MTVASTNVHQNPRRKPRRGGGKVYLVGAGPGHLGLLTLKAVACLKVADVVLHDRLIAPEVLRLFAPKARLVYVGKKASYHTLEQDEIEGLLIKEAKRGRIVVRLKGGDPYIFGRGGEEAERLCDAGIDFEVVPGISSALAVPLFAGIPLTHRRYTPEIAIVTGHENPGKPGASPYKSGVERKASSWIHWPTLARMGTIVFLMGIGNLRANLKKLVENGRSEATPAAAIRWGGLGKQKTLLATIGTLADEVKKVGLKAPAVVVVGDVVSLSHKLNWFERKPFYGQKILITRDPWENLKLHETLADEAAEVIDWPSYEYRTVRPDKKIAAEIRRLDRYDWLIFTSVRAVDFFLSAYQSVHTDYRSLMPVRIAAVGERTAAKLREEKLWVDLIPKKATSEALASEALFMRTSNKRIFLPRGDESLGGFQSCHARRHQVFSPILYRKHRLKKTALERQKILENPPDWILFFSPSAVDSFLAGFKKEEVQKLLMTSKLAVIGKTTAAHLEKLGFKCDVVAKKSTVDGLLQAMRDYRERQPLDSSLRGAPATRQSI